MSGSNGSSNKNPYRRALSGGSAWARSSQGARANAAASRSGRGMTEQKLYALQKGDALDKKLGFPLLQEVVEAEAEQTTDAEVDQPSDNAPKLGWLLNMRSCSLPLQDGGANGNKSVECSALELYFLQQDGQAFKTRVVYQPYFYIRPDQPHKASHVIAYCLRKFEHLLAKAERVLREDLDLPNHLSGKKAVYIKLSFYTVSDLVAVKQQLVPIIERNQAQQKARQAYELQHLQTSSNHPMDEDEHAMILASTSASGNVDEHEACLMELREYDVPYVMRVAIDLDIRVGAWYHVRYDPTTLYAPELIERQVDMVDKAEPIVCAFDIECTKAPLKFPDAHVDQIYMISYMIDRQGFLIVNRDVVSEDVPDFEYTPKPAYPGPFVVFNEANEEALLRRFLEHLVDAQPHIYVTYNGDFFDWPFLETRAKHYGISLRDEIGILAIPSATGVEYRGRSSVHMDAFCWVKRDSYLPQGSQGLKAVTKYKLGYDPVEVDAEDMVTLAQEEPLQMASYSVSDAVATFYLYEKYVHLFVFSLCTIIPLGSEDVLRKGSGTLCEALLMVEAFKNAIICPNKQLSDGHEVFYRGHLVENETYVGGHVECLESGVFRADFEYDFRCQPQAFEALQSNLDRDLKFALEVEMGLSMDQIANYDDVKQQIATKLDDLKHQPHRKEKPLIYHLDVAAMYPNIILTNRLQPCAMVNEADCAACVYNTECGTQAIARKQQKATEQQDHQSCQRVMEWVWRGDFYPSTRQEYAGIKTQLEYENFPIGNDDTSSKLVPYGQLKPDKQQTLLKQRLKSYCSSVYKKTKITKEEKRSATVCMRENPFYVDTVRAFRDRRYEYKSLTKVWKKKQATAESHGDLLAKIDASNKCLVYDSLQLAHKCILNSFYGYVMRKGARWHSMEMAGIVTHTGSHIIQGACRLVEQIGRPLELDTDGIWCILPGSFPETFQFELQDGSKRSISYPCVMLNADVQHKFTNPQYQELDPTTGCYTTRKECSILFEVDGPYKAMVLPASTEEGKLLKKRYAVFNFDHSLAELKGFELKRRGELQLIKAFQSQVFECFLDGATLEECYASVAACANRWLDVIDTKGVQMDDEELMALITENKSMSGTLEEYGNQKSTSITTAKRLSEFLGDEMVKDRGLNCQFIIAIKPFGEKVTERAIPTAIFATKDDMVKRHFLKKWLKDPNLQDFDVRSIVDWEYYRNRFASTVQKIVSLPAAFQNVKNPVPRIPLPDWMRKQVAEKNAKQQQGSMNKFITTSSSKSDDYIAKLIDLEDLVSKKTFGTTKSTKKKPTAKSSENEAEAPETLENPPESVDTEVKLGESSFHEWLQARKRKWKTLLTRRKRLREDSSANPSNRPLKRLNTLSSGMDHFVTNTLDALQSSNWQIVEIQSDGSSGVFTCWVLTDASSILHRVTLKIPRWLYLSSSDEAMDQLEQLLPSSRRVNRLVPHGPSGHHEQVLEVQLSESQYQTHQKELQSTILSDPIVHAVYELQVSPLTRAVCAIGCVAKPSSTQVISTTTEYELQDLSFQSTAQASYLMHDASLRRVLLYVAQQKSRAVVGLVMLNEEEEAEEKKYDAQVYGWFVDPFTKPSSNVKSTELQQLVDQLIQEDPAMQSMTLSKMQSVKTMADAFAGVNLTLANVVSSFSSQKPTIVIAQTCLGSSKRLREKIQGLYSFPVTILPWNEEDMLFPALTWRKLVSEKMMVRFIEMNHYFDEVLDCARYAHVPVGNFTGDHAIAILDTLYSRILHKHKHLWWHSTTSAPDLGTSLHTVDSMATDHDQTTAMVSNKGSYIDICVEFQLDGLAVNAMLVATQIESIEGIGAMQNTMDQSETPATTGAGPVEAFRLLRVLVTTLFKDFCATQNKFADHLLQQFYRWCCSSASLCFDTQLLAMVKQLMAKLFLQLLAECRRLGCQIVYADFQKLVICTSKQTIDEAETYVAFLLQTIASNQLFQVLQLTPTKYLEHLLFLDIENYGAMLVKQINANDEEEEEEASKSEILSHWNIANYLPQGIDDYFLILVGQFLRRRAEYWKKLRDQEEPEQENQEVDEVQEEEEDTNIKLPSRRHHKLRQYSMRLVTSYFGDKLLKIVPEIQSYSHIQFPTYAGSHLNLDNPALELVKFVCAVFGLEPTIDAAVQKVKRTMLKLLQTSEFADDAQFRNPSLSLMVPDVICPHCNLCRSVDLCRDVQFLQATTTEEEEKAPWSCLRCHAVYDTQAFEFRLVEMVEAHCRAFQTHDVVCTKCQLPMEHQMRPYCHCGTPYQLPNAEDHHQLLKICRRVAQQHDFAYLLETVDRLHHG